MTQLNKIEMDKATTQRSWLYSLMLRDPGRWSSRLGALVARMKMLGRGGRRRFGRAAAGVLTGASGIALMALLAGPMGPQPAAAAGEITVDGATCTLIEAIRTANTGSAEAGCTTGDPSGPDTIVLSADLTYAAVYSGMDALPTVTTPITITADTGTRTITLDNSSADFRAVTVSSATGHLTLQNINITGGKISSASGGQLYVSSGASLSISGGTFSGGQILGNYGDGGAIAASYASDLSLLGVTLTGNRARGNGGAVSAIGASSVSIIDSRIVSNTYAFARGGLSVNGRATVVISGTEIAGNYAYNNEAGAGIGNIDDLTIIGSTISNNTSRGKVGGILLKYTTGVISDTVISNNSAGNDGGGLIIAYESEIVVTNSTFSNNSTAGNAGGVGVYEDSLATFNGVTISNNTASKRGGGLAVISARATINGSTISGNTAGSRGGGGVSVEGGQMAMVNSTVSNNSATGDGGGLRVTSGSVEMIHATVTANEAPSGAGLFLSSASATLGRSIISGNGVVTPAVSGNEIMVGSGSVDSSTYNVLGHSGFTGAQAFSGFTAGATDVTAISGGTDPTALTGIINGTLADNGGPTLTHGLPAGSPAINLVPTAACDVDTDQRGEARPQGDDCDAGAVEVVGGTPPAAPMVFMSTETAGRIGDLKYSNSDILKWDGTEWTKWLDAAAADISPSGTTPNIAAFSIADPDQPNVVVSFAKSSSRVTGMKTRVLGTQLVEWDGSGFSLYFDGPNVGLSGSSKEQIDAVHVLPADPTGREDNCEAYLLLSTNGVGRVKIDDKMTPFGGEDLLGFCATRLGQRTTGTWEMVIDGSEEGLARNSLDSVSASADGQTIYLTTSGRFNADGVTGSDSMVYVFDVASGTFSGPVFTAADNGLTRVVDGLEVVGDLEAR